MHGHSPLHRLAPEAKVVAVLLFVVTAAVTPGRQMWAFGVYALLLVLVAHRGRIPYRFILVRLAGVAPFVAFALIIPFVASGEKIQVGWVWVSQEGLWGAGTIMAKAVIGAGASILLVATTEIPELIKAMRRLHIPALLVSIAGFMVRYLELIVEELGRMRTAMAARGYVRQGWRTARPMASAAGAMFVRAYERGERVHAAMLSRGFTGSMPDLDRPPRRAADWLTVGAFVGVAVAVTVFAQVVG